MIGACSTDVDSDPRSSVQVQSRGNRPPTSHFARPDVTRNAESRGRGCGELSREGPMAHDPSDAPDTNPLVTECIEEALAPYRGILSPELLVGFAATLDLFLTTHPVAAP